MRNGKVVVSGVLTVLLVGTGWVEANKLDILQETGSAFSSIAKQALPAVVFIDVETTIEVPQQRYRHPFEDFFGRGNFPGYGYPQEPETRKYHQQGQGSGFIISKDGYILTNNHVVNDADRITVTLGDGREFDAKLVGADPKSEVGLIKIEDGDEFPFLTLGDSDALEVGEWVIAAGNPFGLSQTVTAGIVSAKGRRTGMLGVDGYENFIQTDAAINPGNSGGPLINIHGEVIGINTAIYSRTGGYMGIGFAIPINQAARIKDQLIKYGKVSRSVLGIIIQQVDEDLAGSFGLEESGGILISQVVEGSAAEESGLQEGDIIVEMDGIKADRIGAFRNRVAATPPNTQVELRIFRDGKYKTVFAVTKELDGDDHALNEKIEPAVYEKLGVVVEKIDDDTARRLGYEGEKGVLITEVVQGGSAWRAGLRAGQVITSVERRTVNSVSEFKEALAASGDSGKVLLLVTDGSSSRFVVVTVD
jgi:serine protease Do